MRAHNHSVVAREQGARRRQPPVDVTQLLDIIRARVNTALTTQCSEHAVTAACATRLIATCDRALPLNARTSGSAERWTDTQNPGPITRTRQVTLTTRSLTKQRQWRIRVPRMSASAVSPQQRHRSPAAPLRARAELHRTTPGNIRTQRPQYQDAAESTPLG